MADKKAENIERLLEDDSVIHLGLARLYSTNMLMAYRQAFQKSLPITKELLQKAFQIAWKESYYEDIEKIECFAEDQEVEIDFEDAVKKEYQGLIETPSKFYRLLASNIISVKQKAEDKGISIPSEFEEALNDTIRGNFLPTEIEEICARTGITIDMDKDFLNEGYKKILSTVPYSAVEKLEEIEKFAKERNIRLADTNHETLTRFAQIYYLGSNQYEERKVKFFAKERGIELTPIDPALLQEVYEKKLKSSPGYVSKAEIIAREQGTKLALPDFSEEDIALIKSEFLGYYDVSKMRETEELMKNRGIPIDQFVSPEELTERLGQRHIFYRDNDYSRRKIEEFAEEKGIQLPELPEIEELDFYDEVGDITVHLYGKGTNGLFSGKFIFDFNREKEDYSIIFNNHREYHCDIGFYPKGGGWMKIDERNKKIEVKDSSSDFGYEPRLITALTLIEAFPDYTIDVRS